MVRIFGALDLIIVFMLIARILNWSIPIEMLVFVLIIHFLKAVVFFDVFGGLTDIFAGVMLI